MTFFNKLFYSYHTIFYPRVEHFLFTNRVFKFFQFQSPKITLGRWGSVENKKSLDRRIDMANEDHCGPCGQLYVKHRKITK